MKRGVSTTSAPSFRIADLFKDLNRASELESPSLSVDAFLADEQLDIPSLRSAPAPEIPPPQELLRTLKSQSPLQTPPPALPPQVYVLAQQFLEHNRDIEAARPAVQKAGRDIEALEEDLKEVVGIIEG